MTMAGIDFGLSSPHDIDVREPDLDVTLTWVELLNAADVGVMRRVSSIKEGYNKNKHAKKSDWQTDIDGAAAEQAVAKYLGIYWDPSVRTFKEPDVGEFQVRSTTYHSGHLIIRENDRNLDQTFWLVIARAPIYSIRGVLRCGDAKQDCYWRAENGDEAGGWWVPQSKLVMPPPRPKVQRHDG